jgi:trimeric autotransporter adhesin
MMALPLLAACVDNAVTGPAAPRAPLPESPFLMTLTLDQEWTGTLSTDWGTAGNWLSGVVPDASSGVDIPDASSLTNLPVLGADAEITDLRVGLASTLDLGGFTLTSSGSADAVGAVTNGVLRMDGTGELLAGSVNRLSIDGRVSLERRVVATGGVSVRGSLSVADSLLSIQIP